MASSSLIVGAALVATVFSVGFSTVSTFTAVGTFSLPTDPKSSFLAGESVILRFSREEAAYGKGIVSSMQVQYASDARGKKRDITYLLRGSNLSSHWDKYLKDVVGQEQCFKTRMGRRL